MKKYSLLFIAALFLTASCSSPDESTSNIDAKYELQIVDSVQIDLFSSGLSIADVNDETGEILALQSDPPVAYLLNAKGEVIKTMDRQSGDPQAVGDYLLSGEFYEDGIALMGFMQVKTYDMDFNLRQSTKPEFTHSGMLYTGFNHLFEIKGDDHNRLLAYMGPQTELNRQTPEYYKDLKIATIIDPYLVGKKNLSPDSIDREVYQPIGQINSDSRYITGGKAFYYMKPVIDVRDNFLYYAFQDDTTLYKIALPSGELIEETRIPFDNFILFNGLTMGPAGLNEAREAGPGDRGGSIGKVFKVGDFEVISYSSGMKLADIEALGRDSPDFRERMFKADPQKHLIIKNGLRVNEKLRFPDKISALGLADNDGFLWALQNISDLEEEPDLITFYKLKIVEFQ